MRFVGVGDFALSVEIRAYIMASVYRKFLAIQDDILLRVRKVVKQAGTGFAGRTTESCGWGT